MFAWPEKQRKAECNYSSRLRLNFTHLTPHNRYDCAIPSVIYCTYSQFVSENHFVFYYLSVISHLEGDVLFLCRSRWKVEGPSFISSYGTSVRIHYAGFVSFSLFLPMTVKNEKKMTKNTEKRMSATFLFLFFFF